MICLASDYYKPFFIILTPSSITASLYLFAEAEGFEPPVPCGTPVFKTGAIDQLCQTSKKSEKEGSYPYENYPSVVFPFLSESQFRPYLIVAADYKVFTFSSTFFFVV
jgi:hypothetical protein